MRLLVFFVVVAIASAQDSTEPLSAAVLSAEERVEIAGMTPQDQAARIVERCLTGHKGALELVDRYAEQWRGKLQFEKGLGSLVEAAFNSPRYEVRKAAITVSLAQYGLEPSAATAQQLLTDVPTDASALNVRLWQLGMLGFKGFETERSEMLMERYLRDPNEKIRANTADAMGLLGADSTLPPLLNAFRRDSSSIVRERAGCDIAEGGMLTRAQRRKAVPDLLGAVENPALPSETRSLVYRALRDITGQQLPSELGPWRGWWARAGSAQAQQ